jgi:putative ABC transport system permease protein
MREWIETLGQDLRYAIRRLRESPSFTLVAALSLAIGISANTTIFSATNAVLLRPLPYPDQDRLVMISNHPLKQPGNHYLVSSADLARWRMESKVFEQMEVMELPELVAMSGAGEPPERATEQQVTPGLFSMLGATAILGTIPPEPEITKAGYNPSILSYEFWQRHFRGDPRVLGRTIYVDNDWSTVVAVLSPGFDIFGRGTADTMQPVGVENRSDETSTNRWLYSVGKLKPGITIGQAQAAMDVVAQHLEQAYPDTNKGIGIKIEPLQQGLFGWSRQVLYPLLAAVAFVLLIACANIANLLLARASGRRKEIGIRIALGASRWRLIRQMLTESVLLALLGGVFGLIFTFWGIKLFVALSPSWFPYVKAITINGRVLLFTFALSVLTGVVFGLAPAFAASKTGVNDALKEGGRSSAPASRHRTRNILVVAEVALALVLLVCAGLMINTFVRVIRADPGFSPDHLVTVEIRLTGKRYFDVSEYAQSNLNVVTPQVGLFSRQVIERVKELPGVESAAVIDWLPMAENSERNFQPFTIAGRSPALRGEKPRALFIATTPEYFGVMRIPLRKGRNLTEQDSPSSLWVVVINETMARTFWPNENPIGQVIMVDTLPDERPREIVGVVGDVRQFELSTKSFPEIYAPQPQQGPHCTADMTETRLHKSLVVRTGFASRNLIDTLRRTVAELVSDSPVFGITTVQQTVANSARTEAFFSQLLATFSGVALLLATIGIYGVISYSVGERTREIGLRIALGAQSGQVLALVLKEGMVLALLGVVIGLAISFGATPVLSRFLYGIKSYDPWTLAFVSSLLIGVTILATYIPARRATRVDPLVALRHE